MTHKQNELPPELKRYLALCKRTYERMVRDGSWPWEDSPNLDGVIESDGIRNKKDI